MPTLLSLVCATNAQHQNTLAHNITTHLIPSQPIHFKTSGSLPNNSCIRPSYNTKIPSPPTRIKGVIQRISSVDLTSIKNFILYHTIPKHRKGSVTLSTSVIISYGLTQPMPLISHTTHLSLPTFPNLFVMPKIQHSN